MKLLIYRIPFLLLGARVVGALAAYYNLPVFVWGPTMPVDFSNNYYPVLYPTVMPMSGTVVGFVFNLCRPFTRRTVIKLFFGFSER